MIFKRISILITLALLTLLTGNPPHAGAQTSREVFTTPAGSGLPNPILFVTQVPIPGDFTTIGSTFGNHLPGMQEVGRGGDLWILYPDGTLKNLTEAAGYGVSGFQTEDAIAVRQPAVNWEGTKAVFSMVIGAPQTQYQWEDYSWQLYEITGLGKNDTPIITKVPNQPENYNNVSPIYGTDDQIIFTSDRPFNGQAHLYPQRDEYEEAPVVSGLWSLDPTSGDLVLLDHSPSGDFTPIIDSFGRVIFTRWDHLQRDQQADADNYNEMNGQPCDYCTFNYSSEAANSVPLFGVRTEVFPEPRADHDLVGTNLWGHTLNHFLPWMMNEDGTNMEILNHIGRHELVNYIPPSFTDDPNLVEFYDESGTFNPYRVENMFQIREDPANPGMYYGVNAPEFATHSAGQIVALNGEPDTDADHMAITYITHPDTASYTPNPGPNHSGLYRSPLPLTDGTLLAVHTAETDEDENIGSQEFPQSRYDFTIKPITQNGQYWLAGPSLTGGITKNVSYWNPDTLVTYNGQLWELDPVEVVARTRPTATPYALGAPELQIFNEVGVDPADLQAFLEQYNLALVISRDVTTRDDSDLQQPFNLAIPGGVQTIGAAGRIYEIALMQFFQGDLLRGLDYGGDGDPADGRRILAQPLHTATGVNPPNDLGLPGAVNLASDGSMAAFIPARRAMSWQLTDLAGVPVVRERFWVTFQPGEMRVCTSCHGLNQLDQAGNGIPENPPEALRTLLEYWKIYSNLPPQMFMPVIQR